MSAYYGLFNKMHGTRVRIFCNLTRLTYDQACLFWRVHDDFTKYTVTTIQSVVEAMSSLRLDQIVLRGNERPFDHDTTNSDHQQLVRDGYLTTNQTLLIRLEKDVITLNFGPRSGDNAWEDALIITVDCAWDVTVDESQLPPVCDVGRCFDLLGLFVAAGLVDMQCNTHDDVLVKSFMDHPSAVLFRDLELSALEYLADPAKAKKVAELVQRIANRYELDGALEYGQWPLTRDEHGMWKLDIGSAGTYVKEVWIDEMALLHHFHPNSCQMRTETARKQIKEAWQMENK